jgi:hypothetical protein
MADGIHNPATRIPGPAVRIGLAYIKGAKEKEMEELVRERDRGGPYTDLGELSSRMPLKRQELEQLAWSGALRSLPRGERGVGTLERRPEPERPSATPPAASSPCHSPPVTPPSWTSRRTGAGCGPSTGTIGMTLEGHPMALIPSRPP